IKSHLEELDIPVDATKRLWLHQANINMNNYVSEKVLGRKATLEEAPLVLDEYANTASAGSIIAFHKYNDDLKAGDIGVICSFGAGYSAGSVVVQKTTQQQ
ncbi:MAG: beta-ketoacyl-ACP synthase III, partial [Desulfobacterales bacterium]|nr:beta-ketoacyl-ACP synthase III [Desulfobacterales bacterium]